MLAQTISPLQVTLVVAYLLAIGFLAWLGHRQTKNAADYLIAGRNTHPFIMALSYGATFISTAAIVGFGGLAGMFGMSLLWLVFLNIFVGIFVAFVVLGGRTRRMAHHLGAHTFAEFLGRRYGSRFLQVFAGTVIFLLIPLYAAAVLLGGVKFISVSFVVDQHLALLVFSVIVAAYVVTGGLKGVMYTEALQGGIMLAGMIILLVYTYQAIGGVTEGHEQLERISPMANPTFQKMGFRGWTEFPEFGWGASHNLWWIIVGTFILGVGIGVLAQPQLAVRFMTVNSQKQLNRAVMLGAFFILAIPGTAYVVGSLSNVYFSEHGDIRHGRLVEWLDEDESMAEVQLMTRHEDGTWRPVDGDKTARLLLDAENPIIPGQTGAEGETLTICRGRGTSLFYAGGAGEIIPTFIEESMPGWFGLLFLLTLLAAAMSTLASQFHALGSAIGRDVFEQITRRHGQSVVITRVGIIVGILIAVLLSYYVIAGESGDATGTPSAIIARATAIFFGVCAAAFLPAYVGGLFFRWITRPAAIASMVGGTLLAVFWLAFIRAKDAAAIGIVERLTGETSLLAGRGSWDVIDPILVALPTSIVICVVVSLLTRRPSEEILGKCFAPKRPAAEEIAAPAPTVQPVGDAAHAERPG
ncbi:MAG: sodium:solute symporter family protein [Planctomycetota bacterium]